MSEGLSRRASSGPRPVVLGLRRSSTRRALSAARASAASTGTRPVLVGRGSRRPTPVDPPGGAHGRHHADQVERTPRRSSGGGARCPRTGCPPCLRRRRRVDADAVPSCSGTAGERSDPGCRGGDVQASMMTPPDASACPASSANLAAQGARSHGCVLAVGGHLEVARVEDLRRLEHERGAPGRNSARCCAVSPTSRGSTRDRRSASRSPLSANIVRCRASRVHPGAIRRAGSRSSLQHDLRPTCSRRSRIMQAAKHIAAPTSRPPSAIEPVARCDRPGATARRSEVIRPAPRTPVRNGSTRRPRLTAPSRPRAGCSRRRSGPRAGRAPGPRARC